MKKLIQLLNLYQEGRKSKFKFSSYDYNSSAFIIEKSPKMVLGEETIISKKFGFIQWLWSKGKIRYMEDWEFLGDDHGGSFTEYETRLMYLAIQDNPISFLISILK